MFSRSPRQACSPIQSKKEERKSRQPTTKNHTKRDDTVYIPSRSHSGLSRYLNANPKSERNSKSIPVYPASQPSVKSVKRIPIMNSPDPILLMKKKKAKIDDSQERGYRFTFGDQEIKAFSRHSKSRSKNSISLNRIYEDVVEDKKKQISVRKEESKIKPKNLTPQFSSKKKDEQEQEKIGRESNILSEVPSILKDIIGTKVFQSSPSNEQEKQKPSLKAQDSETSFADICLSEIVKQNSQKELLDESDKEEEKVKSDDNTEKAVIQKKKNHDSVDNLINPENQPESSQLLRRFKQFISKSEKQGTAKVSENLLNTIYEMGPQFNVLNQENKDEKDKKDMKDDKDKKGDKDIKDDKVDKDDRGNKVDKDNKDDKVDKDDRGNKDNTTTTNQAKPTEPDENPKPSQNPPTQSKVSSKKSTQKRSNRKKLRFVPESFHLEKSDYIVVRMPKQQDGIKKSKANKDQLTFSLFKKKKNLPIVQKDSAIFYENVFKDKLTSQMFRELPGRNEFVEDDDITTVCFTGVNQMEYIRKLSKQLSKHHQENKKI